jgi:hypothetical protein
VREEPRSEKVISHLRYSLCRGTYPARIGVEESPEDTIFQNLSHPPTSVQKDSQHAFPLIYYDGVFLGLRWLGRVIGHSVFLGNGRNYKRWM